MLSAFVTIPARNTQKRNKEEGKMLVDNFIHKN